MTTKQFNFDDVEVEEIMTMINSAYDHKNELKQDEQIDPQTRERAKVAFEASARKSKPVNLSQKVN